MTRKPLPSWGGLVVHAGAEVDVGAQSAVIGILCEVLGDLVALLYAGAMVRLANVLPRGSATL